AVSVAASVTYLIIRSTRDAVPAYGSVTINSVPSGAQVFFDGTEMTNRTPTTIPGVPVGTRHRIKVSLPTGKADSHDVDIPRSGQAVGMTAQLTTVKGTILVNPVPTGAEILVNGQVRGVSSMKITDVDIDATRTVVLRHRDFPPHEVRLQW